jgi:hypothetical protein
MMEKCHSTVADTIGINLTAQDVAKTVWRAVRVNMMFLVRWRVDKIGWKILSITGAMGPQFITRYILKKIGGF